MPDGGTGVKDLKDDFQKQLQRMRNSSVAKTPSTQSSNSNLALDPTPADSVYGNTPIFLSHAKPGPYKTELKANEEEQFQEWVKNNNIPYEDSASPDYDMRGYWKALVSGDPRARQGENKHFPDTWKTPYHKSFSNESMYALPTAPQWKGNKLILNGKVIYDEDKPQKQQKEKEGDPAPETPQAYIQKYAPVYGVDPRLVRAMMGLESGGNVNAVGPETRSGDKAIGRMQLMPETARMLGVDPHDPEDNMKGGIMYMSQLLQRFHGDPRLALAAYHAGAGAVEKAGGIPDTNDGNERLGRAGTKTRDYVKAIMSRYDKMRGDDETPAPQPTPTAVVPPHENPSKLKALDPDPISYRTTTATGRTVTTVFDRSDFKNELAKMREVGPEKYRKEQSVKLDPEPDRQETDYNPALHPFKFMGWLTDQWRNVGQTVAEGLFQTEYERDAEYRKYLVEQASNVALVPQEREEYQYQLKAYDQITAQKQKQGGYEDENLPWYAGSGVSSAGKATVETLAEWYNPMMMGLRLFHVGGEAVSAMAGNAGFIARRAFYVANAAIGGKFTFDQAQSAYEKFSNGDMVGGFADLGGATSVAFMTALGLAAARPKAHPQEIQDETIKRIQKLHETLQDQPVFQRVQDMVKQGNIRPILLPNITPQDSQMILDDLRQRAAGRTPTDMRGPLEGEPETSNLPFNVVDRRGQEKEEGIGIQILDAPVLSPQEREFRRQDEREKETMDLLARERDQRERDVVGRTQKFKDELEQQLALERELELRDKRRVAPKELIDLRDRMEQMANQRMYVDAADMARSLLEKKPRGVELEPFEKDFLKLWEERKRITRRLSGAEDAERTRFGKEEAAKEGGRVETEHKLRDAAVRLNKEAAEAKTPEESQAKSDQAEEAGKRAEEIKTSIDQERAAREAAKQTQQEYPLKAPVDSVKGATTTVRLPDGRKLAARYAIVKASDLIVSHDPWSFEWNDKYVPQKMQPRDYSKNREAKIGVMSGGAAFEVDSFHNTDNTGHNGPPVVLSDGRAAGGNGRAMRLLRAYKDGDPEAIHADLVKKASHFGLDPEKIPPVEERPVLVRVLDESPTDLESLINLGQDLNRDETRGFSAAEQAVMSGDRLSQSTLEWVSRRLDDMGDEASLRELMIHRGLELFEKLVNDGVISPTKRAEFINGKGELTTRAKDMFENAMLGKVINDSDLIATMPKSIRDKLFRSLAPLAKIKASDPAWDFTDYLEESVRHWKRIEALTESLDAYGKNKDRSTQYMEFQNGKMIKEPIHPAVEALIRYLDMKPVDIKKGFYNYIEDFEGNQTTLMGIEPPNPRTAFNKNVAEKVGVEVDAGEWGTVRPVEKPAEKAAEAPKVKTQEQVPADDDIDLTSVPLNDLLADIERNRELFGEDDPITQAYIKELERRNHTEPESKSLDPTPVEQQAAEAAVKDMKDDANLAEALSSNGPLDEEKLRDILSQHPKYSAGKAGAAIAVMKSFSEKYLGMPFNEWLRTKIASVKIGGSEPPKPAAPKPVEAPPAETTLFQAGKNRKMDPLPGFEHTFDERKDALAAAQAEQLSRDLLEHKGNISRTAGEMERFSPLFAGTEANPERSLFDPTPDEKRIVGSTESTAKDNNYFQQAKDKLGPNASISEVALEAQRLKDAGSRPEQQVLTPKEELRRVLPEGVTGFASGANTATEIRGFVKAGVPVGVDAGAITEDAIRELESLAGKNVPVFLDSGAFGETEFQEGKPVVSKPISDKEWNRRLDIYDRLADKLGSSLTVVAPDMVGDQKGTISRLEKYSKRLQSLKDKGVRVVIPVQLGEELMPDEFWYAANTAAGFDVAPKGSGSLFDVGKEDYSKGMVAAFPMNKAAMVPEDVIGFVKLVNADSIHLLGMGVANPRADALVRGLRHVKPDLNITMDANALRAHTGQGRAITEAQRSGESRESAVSKTFDGRKIGGQFNLDPSPSEKSPVKEPVRPPIMDDDDGPTKIGYSEYWQTVADYAAKMRDYYAQESATNPHAKKWSEQWERSRASAQMEVSKNNKMRERAAAERNRPDMLFQSAETSAAADLNVTEPSRPGGMHVVDLDRDGKKVGFALLEGRPELKAGIVQMSVSTVYPDQRGKGHGTALYQEAAQRARAAGAEYLVSDTNRSADAERMWKSIQRKVGDSVEFKGGRYWLDLRSQKLFQGEEGKSTFEGNEEIRILRTQRSDMYKKLHEAKHGSQEHHYALARLQEINNDLRELEQKWNLYQANKGAVEFMADGRAIIHLFENADVSTILHEFAHVARRNLKAEDAGIVQDWLKVEDGVWHVHQEEKFARAFEKYLYDGEAPIPELKGVFARLRDWMIEVYEKVKGSSINVKVPDEIKQVFDRMMGGESIAPRAVKALDGSKGNEAAIDLLKSEITKLPRGVEMPTMFGGDKVDFGKDNPTQQDLEYWLARVVEAHVDERNGPFSLEVAKKIIDAIDPAKVERVRKERWSSNSLDTNGDAFEDENELRRRAAKVASYVDEKKYKSLGWDDVVPYALVKTNKKAISSPKISVKVEAEAKRIQRVQEAKGDLVTPEDRMSATKIAEGGEALTENMADARMRVFPDQEQAIKWAKENKDKLRGIQLFTLKDGRGFAHFLPQDPNILFQEVDPVEIDRRIRMIDERMGKIIPEAERVRLGKMRQELLAQKSRQSLAFDPAPGNAAPGKVIRLWTPEGEKEITDGPSRDDAKRGASDAPPELQEPKRAEPVSKPAGGSGSAEQDGPSGRTRPGGKGRAGKRDGDEPRKALRDVPAAKLDAPVHDRGTELYTQEQWDERTKLLRLPSNAPAPTVRIPNSLRRMLIFPGQSEVVESALSGLKQHDAYIIATTTGTGKTYTGSAVLNQLHKPGMRTLVLTTSQDLIHDREKGWIAVARDYDVDLQELPAGVSFPDEPGAYATTYATAIGREGIEDGKWDLIISDEIGEARKWYSSQRGAMMKTMGGNAGKILYMSATPFHTALEIGHMDKLGLWRAQGWGPWSAQFGVYKDAEGNWAGGNAPKKLIKLREQLIERGQFMNVDRNMEGFETSFAQVPLTREQITDIGKIHEAFGLAEEYFKRVKKKAKIRAVKANAATYVKKYLERSRLPQAIELMKKMDKEGWKVILFSETKAERSEIFDFLQPADEAMGGRISELLPPLPDVPGMLEKEFGEQLANYSGPHSAFRTSEKENFNKGEKKHIYVSYAAGGIGVSLHDTSVGGKRPRAVIYLGPPYSGVMFDQAIGRAWRYGTKSNVHAVFMTSNSRPEIRLILEKVAPRMSSLRALVSGIDEQDKFVNTLRNMDSTREGQLAYELGQKVKVDAGDFAETENTHAIQNWKDVKIEPASTAMNKGMKFPEEPAGGPGVIRLFQQDEYEPPEDLELPEEHTAAIENRDGRQEFLGSDTPLPQASRIAIAEDAEHLAAVEAKEDSGDKIAAVKFRWDNTKRYVMAAWDSVEGSRPVKAAKVQDMYWMTNGRKVIRDMAANLGVPDIGIKIARMLPEYHVEWGNIAGPWVQRYFEILRENDISTKRTVKYRDPKTGEEKETNEHHNLVMAKQGKQPPANRRIAKAVEQTTALLNDVKAKLAKENVAVEIYDDGAKRFVPFSQIMDDPHYWPRKFDPEYEIRTTDPDTGQVEVTKLKDILGGELGDNKRQKIIKHMMREYGLSLAQAEDFLESKTRDVPLVGNVERAREFDLPFYRTDPGAMISYLEGAGEAAARTRIFGQRREKLEREITRLPDVKTRSRVREIMDSVLSKRAFEDETRALVSFAADWSVMTKMGFSALKAVGHSVHGALSSNTRAYVRGLIEAATNWKDAHDHAVISGAILEQYKTEMLREYGAKRKLSSKFLDVVGFQGTYEFGRVAADATARQFLERYALPKLIKGKAVEHYRRQLKEVYLLDDDAIDLAIQRGRWMEEDFNRAGKALSDKTMFTFDPSELPPAWRARSKEPIADNVMGGVRVLTLLKGYMFKTTALLRERFIDEAKQGNFRPLLPFVLLYPAMGELIADLTALFTGNRKRYDELFNSKESVPVRLLYRFAGDIAHATGLTILDTILEAAFRRHNATYSSRDVYEFFGGPFLADAIHTFVQLPTELMAAQSKDPRKHGKSASEKRMNSILRWAKATFPATSPIFNLTKEDPKAHKRGGSDYHFTPMPTR